MIKATVTPGVCNLATALEVESADGMHVTIRVVSDCPQVCAMATELGLVNAFEELGRPFRESRLLELAAANRLHTTCLVPVSVLKAMEAAVGMALPGEASVRLERAA